MLNVDGGAGASSGGEVFTSRVASLPSEWCKLSSLCVYIKALLRIRLFRMEQNRGGLSLVSVTSRFARQT